LTAGDGPWTGLRLEVLPGTGGGTNSNTSEVAKGFFVSRLEATVKARQPEVARSAAGQPRLGAWHWAGPFQAGSAREAFDKAFGPESASDLRGTYQGGKVRWEAKESWEDGDGVALKGENSAHYLFRTITADAPQLRMAHLGSAEGLQVWLNGRRVFSRNGVRPLQADQDQVRLWLKRGENRLILKVSQGGASGGFAFRLGSEPLLEAPLEVAGVAADVSPEGRSVQGLLDGNAATGWGVDDGGEHLAWLRVHEAFGFAGGTEIPGATGIRHRCGRAGFRRDFVWRRLKRRGWRAFSNFPSRCARRC
jgi:hypothetical protein